VNATLPSDAFYEIDVRKGRGAIIFLCPKYHTQVNVLTAEVQAFLMDHASGEQAITHYARPVQMVGDNDCKYSLHYTDSKILVSYPITALCKRHLTLRTGRGAIDLFKNNVCDNNL
jgi:hypothetical protein